MSLQLRHHANVLLEVGSRLLKLGLGLGELGVTVNQLLLERPDLLGQPLHNALQRLDGFFQRRCLLQQVGHPGILLLDTRLGRGVVRSEPLELCSLHRCVLVVLGGSGERGLLVFVKLGKLLFHILQRQVGVLDLSF